MTLKDLLSQLEQIPEYRLQQPIFLKIGGYELVSGQAFGLEKRRPSDDLVITFNRTDDMPEFVDADSVQRGDVDVVRNGKSTAESLSLYTMAENWQQKLIDCLALRLVDHQLLNVVEVEERSVKVRYWNKLSKGQEYKVERPSDALDTFLVIYEKQGDSEWPEVGRVRFSFDRTIGAITKQVLSLIEEHLQ